MESSSNKTQPERRQFFGLPQSPGAYLAAPGLTWAKVADWLNARWQLRHANSVGRWTRVSGRVIIANRGGHVSIGERVLFHSEHAPSRFSVFEGGRLELGD